MPELRGDVQSLGQRIASADVISSMLIELPYGFGRSRMKRVKLVNSRPNALTVGL
jgi:hypothetical protein